MTYADVLLTEVLHEFLHLNKDCLQKYPALTALYTSVIQKRGIMAYLESNKRYPFPQGEERVKYKKNVDAVLS